MPILPPSLDPLGKALLDFLKGDKFASVETWSDAEGFDNLPASKFFRARGMMPELERMAIDICEGRVLDIGAGAGSHTLELQKRLDDITAMDISPGACEVMRQRGVKQVLHGDFLDFLESEPGVFAEGERFDSLLMLMNGIGLCGDLPGFRRLLERAGSILKPGGQLIYDSADVMYMYREDEGGQYLDLNKNHYGETTYWMAYEDRRGKEFGWFFIDFPTAQKEAAALGWKAELLFEDDFYAYLAVLKPISK